MDRPMVEQVERRARRLNDMIEKLGIDRSRLARACAGEALSLANRNCLKCSNPSACIDWVDAIAAGPLIPPHFCPNVDLLRSYSQKS